MRIRIMSVYERVFHNKEESFELTLKIYGKEEQIKILQTKITEMVNNAE